MLNTPCSVDSLPRLRRFNSSQTQLCSFAYLSHDEGQGGVKRGQEDKDDKENTKDEEETVARKSAGTPQPSAKEGAKEKEGERQEEPAQSVAGVKKGSSEVLRQPVSEIQGPTGSGVKGDHQDRRDLVEVPLSGLKPPGGPHSGEGHGEGEAGGDTYGDDQKMCCGFFFKVSWSHRITY